MTRRKQHPSPQNVYVAFGPHSYRVCYLGRAVLCVGRRNKSGRGEVLLHYNKPRFRAVIKKAGFEVKA